MIFMYKEWYPFPILKAIKMAHIQILLIKHRQGDSGNNYRLHSYKTLDMGNS